MKIPVILKLALCCLLLADAVALLHALKQRSFTHLLLWNIAETSSASDLYWKPEAAPKAFHADDQGQAREVFSAAAIDTRDFLTTVKSAAAYITSSSCASCASGRPEVMEWGSPSGLLRQLKEGRSGNCFHRSILLSGILTANAIPSRVWDLDNEDFDAVPHSVVEAYDRGSGKWILLDPMFDFYAKNDGVALSLLEFRELLLNGKKENIELMPLSGKLKTVSLDERYFRLVRKVFLRNGSDFIRLYRERYGALKVLSPVIDRMPLNARMGCFYLFGGRDFVHYTDRYDGSIRMAAAKARSLFWGGVLLLIAIPVILITSGKRTA
ncbi:MAG: hypothetical protein ACM3OC_05325 [Deltaproteobacteria bacterium]